MIIQKLQINLEKLQNIPEAERTLFVWLGHIVNEINVLNKMFYICSCNQASPGPLSHAQLSQAFTFVKLLMGKLKEGSASLNKMYHSSKISVAYHSELETEAKDAIKDLKKYFNGNNLISDVRHNFAFHYSNSKQLDWNYDYLAKDLLMYLGEDNGNTLFFFLGGHCKSLSA